MKIEFNFDVFKESFIEEKLSDFYSFEEFEKIIKWISEKKYISQDKDTGIIFLPTNNEMNLSRAFIFYYEQYQQQEMDLNRKKDDNINVESFNRKFANALFNHAMKEITRNLFEKYFKGN
ncbi:MAG: hypothetical protein IKP65_05455, partial [Alphaproteobacteria bacterium]|nr:hypothetical protein [Alphaproteobacteria bacterium]